ncbi:MAG: hypothetical protein P8Q31_08385 [Luminiphilus sp.]|nr:hypothetical protein [Luminiphilus sp.]MDG1461531.1 hypothetical protein [Luminiphilus sp.]
MLTQLNGTIDTLRTASFLAWAGLFLLGTPATAEDALEFDVGGLMFGDLYHLPSHHTPEGNNATGAVLRRIFLTTDIRYGEDWTGRLRFEAFHEGAFENYELSHRIQDMGAGKKLAGHQISGGLIPTISFDLIEAFWGKRYLMRTAPDIQGIAARDLGISAKGKLSQSGRWSYRAMYGSSETWEADKNPHDKFMGAMTWRPTPGTLLDAYVDHESRPGRLDRSTFQLFAAQQTERYSVGLVYTHQDRQEDPTLELAALMGVVRLSNKIDLITQVQRLFQPSIKGNDIAYIPFDPSATATNIVAGIEYRLTNRIFITPNIVYTHYGVNPQGVRPEDDLHLRLTFFFNYE